MGNSHRQSQLNSFLTHLSLSDHSCFIYFSLSRSFLSHLSLLPFLLESLGEREEEKVLFILAASTFSTHPEFLSAALILGSDTKKLVWSKGTHPSDKKAQKENLVLLLIIYLSLSDSISKMPF
ncbi:hypothetical protein Bca101_017728 [Brassica carinata]